MKKLFVILFTAVLLVGCGSSNVAFKNSTIKEAYETAYAAVLEKDKDTLDKVVAGTYDENIFNHLGYTNVHNVFAKEIYKNENYTVAYVKSNVDYHSVKDMPLFEFVCFMNTEDGYQLVLNVDELINEDMEFNTFMQQAQLEVNQYMETETYQIDCDLQQQFIQQNQELLNQAMQNATNQAMQDAQNASNQAMIDAQNAANQAMNQNMAPVAPMPMP